MAENGIFQSLEVANLKPAMKISGPHLSDKLLKLKIIEFSIFHTRLQMAILVHTWSSDRSNLQYILCKENM